MSLFETILCGLLCIAPLFIFCGYLFWRILSLFDEEKEDKGE